MPVPATSMPAPYAPALSAPGDTLSDASADSFGTAQDDVLSARLHALNLSSVTPPRPNHDIHHPVPHVPTALSLSPISSLCGSAEGDDARTSTTNTDTTTATPTHSSASLRDLSSPPRPVPTDPSPPNNDIYPPLAKSVSARTLEIPRGRLECLPRPPRPETPRQLPRPRVFIKQNSCKSTNDTDFERFVMRERDDGSDVTRGSSSDRVSGWERSPEKTVTQLLEEEDDFFFSDEESEVGLRDLHKGVVKKDPFGGVMPADALTSKVHRVLSNLRSISFQNPTAEDMDTAWGQAGPEELSFRKKNNNISSRWRRPRGRISSKNGVQEFECYSEADAASIQSYGSGNNARREREYNTRDAMRGLQGVGGRYKKSLWNGGGRRDRSPAMAAHFLVGNNGHGYLAAATTLNEPLHTVTAVVPKDVDAQERRRGSVDKYVEFIHASAQRESKNKKMSKNFTGRVITRAQGLFRRKWKI